jgi:hypothetical protein
VRHDHASTRRRAHLPSCLRPSGAQSITPWSPWLISDGARLHRDIACLTADTASSRQGDPASATMTDPDRVTPFCSATPGSVRHRLRLRPIGNRITDQPPPLALFADPLQRIDSRRSLFRAMIRTYLLVNGAPAARTPGQNRTAGRSIHRLGAECRWWTVHPLW